MRFRTLLVLITAATAPSVASQTPATPAPPDAQVEAAITHAFQMASAVANVTRMVESLTASLDSVTAGGPDTVLLIPTEAGFRLATITDGPLEEVAALLTRDARGWHLRTLSPGDVPSEMAARPVRPWLSATRLFEMPGGPSQVTFEISGQIEGDPTDYLFDLSEATVLRSLSAEADSARVQVRASFRFASILEWAEWRAQPEIRHLLDRLEGVRMRLDATPQ